MCDFRNWLLKQRSREDQIGQFATLVFNYKEWDGKQTTLRKLVLAHKNPQFTRLFENTLLEFKRTPKNTPTSARGPYTLENGTFNKTFQKKSDILTYYRDIKDNNKDMILSQELSDAVIALFKYHPDFVVLPDAVVSVEIDNSNSHCFHFDGEPRSYVSAYNAVGHDDKIFTAKKYKIHKLIKTCRHLIKDQLPEKTLTNTHIDHKIFFVHLLHDWFLELDLYMDDIEFDGNGTETRFKNELLNDSWRDYHKSHAILEELDASENIAKQPARIDWLHLFRS